MSLPYRRFSLLAQDAAVKAVQFHPQGVAVRLNRTYPPVEQRPGTFPAPFQAFTEEHY
jgi:hypothetical protein